MVIYPVFTKWKTRRALLRGALLAGVIWLALLGLNRQLPGEQWPGWLSLGDWGRCIAAGLIAVPTGLIDYGYRNRKGRAPLHLVSLVLVVAWLGLLLIYLAPFAGGLLQQLSEAPAKAAEQARDLVLRVGAPCTFPAAVIFALCTRTRWNRSGASSHLKAPLGVALLSGVVGLFAFRIAPTPEVSPFLVLVAAPLLIAVFLPSLAFLVDRVDGWVFPLPDDPTRAPSQDDPDESDRRPWESSGERVFSWNRPKPEAEEPEPDRVPKPKSGGDLDALADDLFGE